ncbi:hypothetical protein [uncultured Methanolobus sp.]|uniref:hypothetical protein n=1 Tax=uncultured Methanolobus sp. TaxID=218300 RepID=UPI002AAAEA0D|nr:hypothetical protein [uncultured Methanolobus sp.]
MGLLDIFRNRWKCVGTDKQHENGVLMLKEFVHHDILKTLDRKAEQIHGSKTVYAKGRTYYYKAVPKGDWFSNHGHGDRWLKIYRKKRQK